jgi:predicted signal transduction protein with EAL and GGDEF domain
LSRKIAGLRDVREARDAQRAHRNRRLRTRLFGADQGQGSTIRRDEDRSFVTDCGTDKVNAPVCKTVIGLAHSFGALAVGIGIEKASELTALVSMGCDLGQGFLLGQPMPSERFISLLKQRANVRPTVTAISLPAQAAAAAS